MKIGGKIWKSETEKFWLAEIPFLNFMVQATSKEEIPETIKEAIELFIDSPGFEANVSMSGNTALIDSNDTKKLIALILRRQRSKMNLNLEEVAENLNAKSLDEYAQYEQAKHLPSLEKLEQLLKAIDPELTPYLDAVQFSS
jgi:hypothetical protein